MNSTITEQDLMDLEFAKLSDFGSPHEGGTYINTKGWIVWFHEYLNSSNNYSRLMWIRNENWPENRSSLFWSFPIKDLKDLNEWLDNRKLLPIKSIPDEVLNIDYKSIEDYERDQQDKFNLGYRLVSCFYDENWKPVQARWEKWS